MKTTNPLSVPRLPGRPREFDAEAALDGALQVFRERGYHATSIPDLCQAMQLSAGSLYKAYKDKRSLFLAAFDRYVRQRHTQLRPLLERQPTGRAKIGTLLQFYAESSFGSEGRRGCLVAGSAAELATYDDEMAARVVGALQDLECLLAKLIRQGQADGSIADGVSADDTARTLLCVVQGMRIIGKLGKSREGMLSAAQAALCLL
ncbi:TetR/AcrR family transcriptional regulator [Martelella alba]|uniref:TetR/AcrR family transcriptional regulator n=1 Tax=Martelella alba TaxID=2590451 RepID=A0ABY2SJ88_9HYPH|nr:TetR/AcrR family transcriptional regulator [Martelella alba]TKI05503.1 TetR/AcrR family transcriptional regulator [Martelella alba]